MSVTRAFVCVLAALSGCQRGVTTEIDTIGRKALIVAVFSDEAVLPSLAAFPLDGEGGRLALEIPADDEGSIFALTYTEDLATLGIGEGRIALATTDPARALCGIPRPAEHRRSIEGGGGFTAPEPGLPSRLAGVNVARASDACLEHSPCLDARRELERQDLRGVEIGRCDLDVLLSWGEGVALAATRDGVLRRLERAGTSTVFELPGGEPDCAGPYFSAGALDPDEPIAWLVGSDRSVYQVDRSLTSFTRTSTGQAGEAIVELSAVRTSTTVLLIGATLSRSLVRFDVSVKGPWVEILGAPPQVEHAKSRFLPLDHRRVLHSNWTPSVRVVDVPTGSVESIELGIEMEIGRGLPPLEASATELVAMGGDRVFVGAVTLGTTLQGGQLFEVHPSDWGWVERGPWPAITKGFSRLLQVEGGLLAFAGNEDGQVLLWLEDVGPCEPQPFVRGVNFSRAVKVAPRLYAVGSDNQPGAIYWIDWRWEP